MKKLLILILIGLLLVLSIFAILKGVKIGETEIYSIEAIKEKSMQLDEKIQEASKTAEKDYNQALEDIKESTKNLKQQKSTYEEITQINANGENAAQIQRYEIETLWVKLGNHATSEGATMKMEILPGSTGAQNSYNLRFTVTGTYISIVDFISDIENDTTLGFKIEEFKMIPSGSDSNLEATFVCKDITIKDINSSGTESENVNNNVQNSTSNTNQNTNNVNDTNSNNTNNNNTVNSNTTNTNANNTSNNANNTTNNTNSSR